MGLLVARKRKLVVIGGVRGVCVADVQGLEEGSSLGDGGCAWIGEAFHLATR